MSSWTIIWRVVLLLTPATLPSQPLQVPPFSSVETHDGAHVFIRQGSPQRVTLVEGTLDYSRITVDNGRLVIEKCVREHCPRGYQLDIEIVVPVITSLSIESGGLLQTRGAFAPRGELTVSAHHGGTVDTRSLPVDKVSAFIEQGGRILTTAQRTLFATVTQGGHVEYWGDAQAKTSIKDGGVVTKGRKDEINKPAFDVQELPAVPVIPVLPIHHH
ncbi:MAG TPA: DUF2807 domain-containing protein [Gemmatimonadaceae bacterium]|nr:DUF2807 domain-containing protein [Gemmatimonadaceae bacterium]